MGESEQKLQASLGDIGLLQRDVTSLKESQHRSMKATSEAVSKMSARHDDALLERRQSIDDLSDQLQSPNAFCSALLSSHGTLVDIVQHLQQEQQKFQQQQQQQQDESGAELSELSSRVERLERERLTADTGGQGARGNGWASKQLAEQLDNLNITLSHMRGDMTEMQEHLHRGSSTPPVDRLPAAETVIATTVNDTRLLCTQLCELVSCLEQRCAALEETLQLAGGVSRPLSSSASAWSTSTNNKLKEELSHRGQATFKEHLVESLARVGMSVHRLTPRQQQQQHQNE